MAGKKQARNSGQFKPGESGNPSGRPPSHGIRLDGFVNQYTGHGTSYDAGTFTRHHTRPVSETEAIDLRRGNWLAKRIVELRPADCMRRGFTVRSDDKEKVEKLMALLEQRCVAERLVAAGQMENTVGGAALFPVLDGATGDLSEPLDLDDSPRILSVRAIHLLESRELMPLTWYDDISSPKFRRPSRFQVQALSSGGTVRTTGVVIHESRLAVFPGVQVSAEQQPGQPWGWGDSKLTPVLDVINNFGLSWGSAASILRNFGERIIKIKELTKILAAKGGKAALEARLAYADRYRSTLRGQIFEDTDSVETLLTSIAGMSDLLTQLAQLVSAAAGEPMTRLFGMSPAGMNATGEYDQQMGHELIASEQQQKYREPLEWLVRLFMLCADSPFAGAEPDVWSVDFKPLKHPSELEMAQTRKLIAETDQINIDMGQYTADDAAESHYKGDTFSADITIDWARRENQKKAEEQMAAEQLKAAQAESEAMKQGAVRPEDDDEEPIE